MEPGDHLFRHEAGRMVAALTRLFGVHNLALAEDVVQDAFCRALEVWKLRGVPENPSAWLMATAKNRAIDILRRERTARTFAPELGAAARERMDARADREEAFGESAIRDDQLRMMFSCCHPAAAGDRAGRARAEHPVRLRRERDCGCISHRPRRDGEAHRARKRVLAGSKRLFDLCGRRDVPRGSRPCNARSICSSTRAITAHHAELAVRADLCIEAMRLAELLLAHPVTSTPATRALVALMYLNAARMPARVNASGNLSALYEQDRGLWDRALIAKGEQLLDHSATGTMITEFHIEAGIASLHARASSLDDTDWPTIVSLYDTLMALNPSPVVALSRAIAVAQHEGAERGLAEIAHIADVDRLAAYPFYYAALGELEHQRGNDSTAREHFLIASARARNPFERNFFERRAQEVAGSAS